MQNALVVSGDHILEVWVEYSKTGFMNDQQVCDLAGLSTSKSSAAA